MKKINSLEGIRTLGCISVFLCHFRLTFLPDRTFWLLDNTPLRIMTDGSMAVRILFVLSGFVVSYKYFVRKQYEEIPWDILKRYFRLAPSVVVAELSVYLLMRLNLFRHIEAGEMIGSEEFLGAFNNFTPDFLGCVKEAFVTCFLQGANGYIGPLWTMTYEYFGVILVLCAISVCRDRAMLRYVFYLVVFVFFDFYYNDFVLGMFLCDVYTAQAGRKETDRHNWAADLMFLAGGYLVTMFRIEEGGKMAQLILAAGCGMMFWGVLRSSWGERLLGGRWMQIGGRMSFAFYIVHWPVMESFSCAYYLWLMRAGASQLLTVASCLVLTVLLALAAAYVFCHYVERIGEEAVEVIRSRGMRN